MKKSLIIFALFFASILNIFAQKKIEVKESNENIGSGNHNALVITIYEAKINDIEKAWKKLMKDYDAKVDMGKEIFADNALVKSASTNTMDIYAKVESKKDGESVLIVAVDLGGAYMSSSAHSDQFKEIKKIVYDFAVNITKETIAEQIKNETKTLEKLQKVQEGLVKDNTDLHKDIENYKEKIAKAEKDIEKNLADQEVKKKEIETQQKVVELVTEKEKAVN